MSAKPNKKNGSRKKGEEYDREIMQMIEHRTAFFALYTAPERPGKPSNLIENQEDLGVYYEGVMVALSMMNTANLELKTDTWQDAMEAGDLKVQKILMEASEDVQRARDGISNKAKHVASLIAAKLELENSNGFLPSQAAVKKRARVLYTEKFKGNAYALDDQKSWREAINAAGLEYLRKQNEE
jgi:hypothetical protein